VEVEVSDEGPGLPPGDAERLFDRFVRGGFPGHSPSGTGLGLAICRAVVNAHSGSIRAEQSPGGGACFRFRLPLE
jgi:two-component system sensor histidine kinase KdpD